MNTNIQTKSFNEQWCFFIILNSYTYVYCDNFTTSKQLKYDAR